MSRKYLPYLFLFILIILLIFIGGVKYGQKVEQANKVINYVLSITPTKPAPTPQVISYKTYVSDYCGIKFIYPSNLTPKLSLGDSETVEFKKNNSTEIPLKTFCIGVDSFTESFEQFMSDSDYVNNASTTSATIHNTQVVLYKKNDAYFFKLDNIKQHRHIGIIVSSELYPLIENSLVFITPTPTKPASSLTPIKKPTVSDRLPSTK